MLSFTSGLIVTVLISLAGLLLWRKQLDHTSEHFDPDWHWQFILINTALGAVCGTFPHVVTMTLAGFIYMTVLQVLSDHYRIKMMHASVDASMNKALDKIKQFKF